MQRSHKALSTAACPLQVQLRLPPLDDAPQLLLPLLHLQPNGMRARAASGAWAPRGTYTYMPWGACVPLKKRGVSSEVHGPRQLRPPTWFSSKASSSATPPTPFTAPLTPIPAAASVQQACGRGLEPRRTLLPVSSFSAHSPVLCFTRAAPRPNRPSFSLSNPPQRPSSPLPPPLSPASSG